MTDLSFDNLLLAGRCLGGSHGGDGGPGAMVHSDLLGCAAPFLVPGSWNRRDTAGPAIRNGHTAA